MASHGSTTIAVRATTALATFTTWATPVPIPAPVLAMAMAVLFVSLKAATRPARTVAMTLPPTIPVVHPDEVHRPTTSLIPTAVAAPVPVLDV